MKKVSVTYCFIILFFTSFSQAKNPFEIIRNSIPVTANAEQITNNNLTGESISISKVITKTNPFEIDTVREMSKSSSSIFKSMENPSLENPKIEGKNESFVFVMILLALLLLTLSIVRDRKAFNNLYKLFSNKNYLKLVNRDINGGKMVFFVLLYVVFLICLSLFVYHYVITHYSIDGFAVYGSIFAMIAGIYLIRHLSLFILGRITLTSQLISDYNFLIIVSNSICGLLLFPVVILLNYSSISQIMLYLGLVLIIICYILRQGNGALSTVEDKQANLFHFFIYICTFEIAPAMIILKLIQEYTTGI